PHERLTPPASRPGHDDRLAARHGLERRALPGRLAAVEERNDNEGGARIDVTELERGVVCAVNEVGISVYRQRLPRDDMQRQVGRGREERRVIAAGVGADADQAAPPLFGRRRVPPELTIRSERKHPDSLGWHS